MCGYSSVSLITLNTGTSLANDKNGLTSASETCFTGKAGKMQAAVLTNRMRGKDASQNEISGDDSFQSKRTQGGQAIRARTRTSVLSHKGHEISGGCAIC